VVEDDAAVRSMAARVLSEAGYAILEAENGRAALELVGRHTGRLDLVLTDIGMPEVDGYELARCLHNVRPGLPVMFMTGYGDAVPSGRTSVNSARPILQKPFPPDALLHAVAAVLTGQQP
jgi:CheY-like chemotaxis protein